MRVRVPSGVLLVFVLVLVVLVQQASADSVDRSVAVASQIFPGHCDDHDHVVQGRPADRYLDALSDRDGEALGAVPSVGDPTCTMYVRSGMPPVQRCEVIVHEKGHQEGYVHTDEDGPHPTDPGIAWIMDAHDVLDRTIYQCLSVGGPNPLGYVQYAYPRYDDGSYCDEPRHHVDTCYVMTERRFIKARVTYSPDGSRWSVEPVRRGPIKNL